MRTKHLLIYLFLLFLWIPASFAQRSNSQKLEEMLNTFYQKGYNDIKTYLISDKDVYEIGETIWLSSLVLDRRTHQKYKGKNTLKVVLYNTTGESDLATKLYCTEGVAKGSLTISQGFSPGRYILSVASGNESVSSFQKEIIIKQSAVPLFIADISFENKYYAKGDVLKAFIKLKGYHNEPIKTGSVTVQLVNRNVILTEEKVKVEKNGIAIAFIKLPDNISSGLTLHLEIKKKGSIESFNVLVPLRADNIYFHCVPDGKTLVHGVSTKVYFKTNDSHGNPFPFIGRIVDNSEKLITEVSADENGEGVFTYLPAVNEKLSLVMNRPFNGKIEVNLPKLQLNGASLNLAGESDNELVFEISKSQNTLSEFSVAVIHQGKSIYFIELDTKESSSFSISKEKFKPGVSQITLFDSTMKPLSEQLYFSTNEEKETVQVELSSSELELREEADVSISSIDKLNFSLRIIDKTRLKYLNLRQNIVSFLYFGSEILDPIELEDLEGATKVNYKLKFCTSSNVWNSIIQGAGFFGQLDYFAKGWTTNFEKSPLVRTVQKGIVHYSNYVHSEYYLALNPDLQAEVANKIRADNGGKIYKEMLANGTPVRDVLNTLKAYNVVNDMIVFYGSAVSINSQDGAMIIIDGINRGKRIATLDAIQPMSVKSMRASSDPLEIQRYTSFNTIGIVEITLKDGKETLDDNYEGEKEFEAPEYPDKGSKSARGKDLRTTIQWIPFQQTTESSNNIKMYHSDIQSKVLGIVEGIDSENKPFFKTFEYSTY